MANATNLRASLLFFILVTVSLAQSLAQSPVIDSIQQQLNVSSGTQRVDLLNEYGYIMLSYDYIKARTFIDEALALSKELHYDRGMAEALLYQGLIENSIGNDLLGLIHLRKGLALAKNDAHLRGHFLAHIGKVRQNIGLLDSASIYYQQSYQLLKDSLNPLNLSFLYLNLASLYSIKSNQALQLRYLLRSWNIRKRLREKHPMVWAGVNLASYYIERGDYKLAKEYLSQSKLVLGMDTVNNEEICVIYKYLGVIHATLGNHVAALDLFSRAKNFYERNPFPWDLVNLLIEIGFVQAQVANYETSLKYYFQALKLAEANHFEQQASQLNFRIARVYYFLDQNAQAEEFAKKSLAYSTSHNLELDEAFAGNLLGSINIRYNQFEVARTYFNRALALRQKNDSKTGVAGTLGNLGELYEKENNLEKAEEFELKALAMAEQLDYALGKCYSYQSLGKLYLNMKEYEKAQRYLDKGEAFARKIHYYDVLSFIYKNKSDLWRGKHDYQMALIFSDKHQALKDSLLNKNVANRILSLQYDFELDKKDKEIKILGQQHQIQKDELELQRAKIRQQRFIIIVGLIIFNSFCLWGYFILRFYRKVKKLNREISEQNEEITSQSEELIEANEALGKMNREISEQKEEIQAQSEELIESNETISRVNTSLEEKVKTRTAELKEAYNELDTFFYRSSHDFRRPLTTFMGLAEVAKITVKDHATLELFEKVNETAHNLDKMLLKLQSVSAVGSQELIYSEVLLDQIFQIELDSFREEIIHKSIKVLTEIKLEQPFFSYPVLVKFIIQNLLENSIAFCGVQSPFIKLKAYQVADETVLEVSDNGQGIESTYLNRIFEMYFRANERSRGNGLGLYIVKKMVDKLNGRIELKSELGLGTTVWVYLPNHFK